MEVVLAHSEHCISVATRARSLFDGKPASTEKVAAHALFLRCVDHYRAAVVLGKEGLDVEALSLVRGIYETMFVVGALLTGHLSTTQLEKFDLAQKAKNAREMSDFLMREATPEVRQRMSEYGVRHKGETDLRLQQLAGKIGESELYDGQYRMFSHVATHPSLTAVQKYLDYGERETTVRYPASGLSAKEVILNASVALLHVCASLERWLGTTPEVNRAIRGALDEHVAFGPRSSW